MGAESAPARDTVIVFTGGDAPAAATRVHLPDDAYVIAADSGLGHALAMGRSVDLAVGDFDSVQPRMLEAAAADGMRVERHPTAKDKTDLELALDRALEYRPGRIVVVGGAGGRLDHFLGNAMVLTMEKYEAVTIEAYLGEGRVIVVRAGTTATLRGAVGDLVSLLAIGGPARGIRTEGLRYPLRDETLEPGSSRGLSNEHVAEEATVAVGAGVLIAVAPGG